MTEYFVQWVRVRCGVEHPFLLSPCSTGDYVMCFFSFSQFATQCQTLDRVTGR